MPEQRHLHLNLVANDLNLHQGAYKYERAQGVPERSTFERLLEYGAFGDEGLFTALFVGDIPGMQGSPAFDGGPAEPITALTAISQHTEHVGLIATASTTFYDPYTLARLLASLDQVSDGRAGYNAVTSVIDRFALNYSLQHHLDRAERYQRADEFLQVLRALWDNRAMRRDPDGLTRFYAEPIDHQGNLFQVCGPLNIAPSRQHRPLIAQAGGSGPGIKVAAKHAEMVFTNSSTRAGAAVYREALDKALIEQGRTPGSVPAIPGLIPYLGRTVKEAEEKLRELDSHVDWEPLAPFALGQFGIDIPLGDITEPFPTHLLPRPEDVEGTIKSTFGNYVGLYDWIRQHPAVTVREVVAQAVGRGGHATSAFAVQADLIGTVHNTSDVAIDTECGGPLGMFGDAGVPAHGQAQPPTVHFQHGGLARAETIGFAVVQIHLPVEHRGAAVIHCENTDMRSGYRRTDQCNRPSPRTCGDDGSQPIIVRRNDFGIQLVPGQRHLREHHNPRPGRPDQLGVCHRILGYRMSHTPRLGDSDPQGLPHWASHPQLPDVQGR